MLSLKEKFYLGYVSTPHLLEWIKENNLISDNFLKEKKKWNQWINKEPNFFSDSELLLVYQDIVLLQVSNQQNQDFLAKTYQLSYQQICQELWQEKKNLIIVTEKQWRQLENSSEAVVLLKDEDNIKEQISSYFR